MLPEVVLERGDPVLVPGMVREQLGDVSDVRVVEVPEQPDQSPWVVLTSTRRWPRPRFRIKLSADGGRLLTWSPDGRIDLWDLATRRSIWSRRVPVSARDTIDLSGDGGLVLWSRGAELLLSSVGGGESALRLDDAIGGATFSYDGSRFGIVTHGSIGVWTVEGLHAVWRIPRSSPVHQEVY